MTTLIQETEQMILRFFQGKDNDDLKRIQCGRDVDDHLDEETVEEIKDQIWYLLKTQHIRWYYLADAIKDMVDHTRDEEEEDQEDDEDTQSDPGW